MSNNIYDNSERAVQLLAAQKKALEMFDEIERDLIRPGIREKVLNNEIYQLGATRYGIETHWHKRLVRSGPNALRPFQENPPDRVIGEDDILVVDLGPVFESWEADFGRTYVLGDDPHKKKIRDALEPIWNRVRSRFLENPDMTGEELYNIAVQTAEEDGWSFGADLAGHLVGSFPHERIPRDKTTLYILKGNKVPMSTLGKDGKKRHWILEIHLRDYERGLAAFYEQLLTAG
ncbi:hypothetical protein LRP88_10842 [Fusarium phalaenopsidis]|nr:Peptidase-M24 domain-containing protein [Fusarium sp. Ph1]